MAVVSSANARTALQRIAMRACVCVMCMCTATEAAQTTGPGGCRRRRIQSVYACVRVCCARTAVADGVMRGVGGGEADGRGCAVVSQLIGTTAARRTCSVVGGRECTGARARTKRAVRKGRIDR